MLNWFWELFLHWHVQAGLNKGEARNVLVRAVFMHLLGEIRERGLENHSYWARGLTLLTAAISLIERAIDYLERAPSKLTAYCSSVSTGILLNMGIYTQKIIIILRDENTSEYMRSNLCTCKYLRTMFCFSDVTAQMKL